MELHLSLGAVFGLLLLLFAFYPPRIYDETYDMLERVGRVAQWCLDKLLFVVAFLLVFAIGVLAGMLG
jgi:hypothetical protein